jgi:hypothetical protein
MLLQKIAGLGACLFTTVICFILLNFIVDNETSVRSIYNGLLILAPYILTFLILATFLTMGVDALRIKNKMKELLGYLFVGILIAGIIATGIYRYTELSVFVVISCILGSISFYLTGRLQNKYLLYCFSSIPVIFVLIYIFS